MSNKSAKINGLRKTANPSAQPSKFTPAGPQASKPAPGRGKADATPKAGASKATVAKREGARVGARRPLEPVPAAPAGRLPATPALSPADRPAARPIAAVTVDGTAGAVVAPPVGRRPTVDRDGRDPRLPAIGTTLVKRDRQGRRCEVRVEAGGFRLRDTLYASHSAAASAAAAALGLKTGVNGYAFFGLAKPDRPAKNPAEHLRKIASRYEERAAALLKHDTTAELRNEVRREVESHAAHLTDLLAKSAA